MTSVTLPYLHIYQSSGAEYAYFRRGAVRLRLPGAIGSAEFLEAYRAAVDGYRAPAVQLADAAPGYLPDSMGALIAAYSRSHEYRSLGNRTREGYGAILGLIGPAARQLRVREITRAYVTKRRDKLAETPYKANYFVAVMSVLLSWAVERGWIDLNPAKGVRRLKTTGGHRPWTDAEIEAFTGPHAGLMALPVALALYTGQRLGDVIRLPWNAYDGQTITLTQSKTGARLALDVHPVLQDALDAALRSAITICTRADGHSWKIDHFKHAFAARRVKLGLPNDLHFHGLRHSSASRLAEAGASDALIQSVTGHKSRTMVAHYTAGARQKEMATAAIAMLPRGRIKNTIG